jgi:hypothetical protein
MARLPRLIGRSRALEVLLGADDIRGDMAELFGYVNRSLPDADLDSFVDAIATRIASFDKWAIANTKRLVNGRACRPTSRSQPGGTPVRADQGLRRKADEALLERGHGPEMRRLVGILRRTTGARRGQDGFAHYHFEECRKSRRGRIGPPSGRPCSAGTTRAAALSSSWSRAEDIPLWGEAPLTHEGQVVGGVGVSGGTTEEDIAIVEAALT